MFPLIALTHSQLIRDSAFEPGLLASTTILLNHGANPNATWTNPEFPDWPLSAVYSAAGFTHNPAMTHLLLAAGTDWRTRHNFNDNIVGTLAYASKDSDSKETDPGDFVSCARSLIASGVPISASEGYYFSPQVEDYLDLVRFQESYSKFGEPGTPD